MHTFQVNSHISENGVLSIKLPREWAGKEVNVLLVLEALQGLQEVMPNSLTQAFDLLTQMPDDFMNERLDHLPQPREEWL